MPAGFSEVEEDRFAHEYTRKAYVRPARKRLVTAKRAWIFAEFSAYLQLQTFRSCDGLHEYIPRQASDRSHE